MLLLRVAESNAALRDERKAQAADVEHLRAQLATLRHRVGDPDEVPAVRCRLRMRIAQHAAPRRAADDARLRVYGLCRAVCRGRAGVQRGGRVLTHGRGLWVPQSVRYVPLAMVPQCSARSVGGRLPRSSGLPVSSHKAAVLCFGAERAGPCRLVPRAAG
jgi:hypothetical protein